MRMPTATLTSKGQTTIPREVREFLKLKTGDKLEFRLNSDGSTVTLTAANIDILALKGILKREGAKPYNPSERALAYKKRVLTK
jgi:antitoxin PrlF